MKKKALIVLLALVLVCATAFSLAACNKKPMADPDFQVPDGGYDGSEVTITFAHTMGTKLQSVMNNAITKFNEKYPNIKVEPQYKGGYDEVLTQINTALAGGIEQAPSLAYCYSDHVAVYNLAKAVIKLDNLANSDKTNADGSLVGFSAEQKSDLIENFYNEGKNFEGGGLYQLPVARSTDVLFYNVDFFNEHKTEFDVPTHWWCTEACPENCKSSIEFVCKKIKEIDSVSVPFGYDSEANWFITMCEQLGSGYTTLDGDNNFIFNNDTNKAFVKKFREWRQKGYITTKILENGKYISDLFKVGAAEGKQKCYMCVGSTGGTSYQLPSDKLFEVGITMMPQSQFTWETNAETGEKEIKFSNPKAISQGPSACIFNKSNKQEVMAAWLFAKFLATNVEFQANYAISNGYIPVIKSVEKDDLYKQWIAKANGKNEFITALGASVCQKYQNTVFTSPAFNGSSSARAEVGKMLAKCLSTKTDNVDELINTAFKDAVNKCIYDQQ